MAYKIENIIHGLPVGTMNYQTVVKRVYGFIDIQYFEDISEHGDYKMNYFGRLFRIISLNCIRICDWNIFGFC